MPEKGNCIIRKENIRKGGKNMRKKFLRTSLLIFSMILMLGVIAKPAAQGQGVGHEDVLIGFKKFPGKSEKAQVEKAGGKIKYAYHLIPVIAASVPSAAIKGLRHNPNVTYVEEDGDVFIAGDWTPNELADSWGVDRVDADLVWNNNDPKSKGAGVYVAILDTGIDKDHPDLMANIAGGVNFSSGKGKDKTPDPDAWNDGHGHGTHCAGVVAADDNGFGVVGVAPDLRFNNIGGLYGVKVLDDRGRGKASDFIAGLQWAVDGPDGVHDYPYDADNADIVSISLRMWGEGVTDACDAAYAAGLLLVSSAGNNWGGGVTGPANHPSVLAVSAIDELNIIADFSSTGPDVELAAPGVDVYSCYRNGGYTFMDGTSMACPHVAGVAALAWATDNYVFGSAVRYQLNRTATPLGSFPFPNEEYGNGLVHAVAAVASPNPAFNLEVAEDNETYLEGPDAQVTLTVTLRDQFGYPVTDIQSILFQATLIDNSDPNTVLPRDDFIVEPTGIPGIYTGSFSIGDLNVEEDDPYKVVVTAEQSNPSRFGSGEDNFYILAITGEILSVDLQTDKSVYTMGERIYTTVTVKDESGNAVEGALVHLRVETPSDRFYNDEKYTDVNGVAQFSNNTKKPDGRGTWRVRASVEMPGYMDGWAVVYPEVK
jgi:subtilisin family serine protease